MRISLRSKLVATYLLISIFTALVIYILTYFTSEQRVQNLAQSYQTKEMVQEVRHWYAAEQTWVGFPEYFKSLHPPMPDSRKPDIEKAELNKSGNKASKKAGLVTADKRALLRYLKFQPGDIVPKAYLENASPVKYQGEVVAWVIPPEATGISLNSQLQVFLDNILDILLMSVAVSILISLIFGAAIAKYILKPVESLTKASSAIASGDLTQEVSDHSNDEIGDLSRSFNKMSKDLARADKQRRQLTADVAHDLGTPVQVISGYIEMAQDGVLDLDDERVDIISSEIAHIQRLLKDMSLLAKTDAKALSIYTTSTDIRTLLERVIRMHQLACQENQITLALNCADSLPAPELDEERMVQVLGNLIRNAIRYVPKGGKIEVASYCVDQCLTIKVSDTGCGIQQEDLPFVFDRFYRSDPSRTGKQGSIGLGLSIAQGLVNIQGGTIRVESDGKSGSHFIIDFKLQRKDM
ncbi:sensor histidine kinase [Vibrio sp. HN007]|uniref:sensor histidine kinase n=1 Tax=Vibrio iocasae TaxID=3098914 RepID=UPI0035D4F362